MNSTTQDKNSQLTYSNTSMFWLTSVWRFEEIEEEEGSVYSRFGMSNYMKFLSHPLCWDFHCYYFILHITLLRANNDGIRRAVIWSFSLEKEKVSFCGGFGMSYMCDDMLEILLNNYYRLTTISHLYLLKIENFQLQQNSQYLRLEDYFWVEY